MTEIRREPAVDGPSVEIAEAEWTPRPGTGAVIATGVVVALADTVLAAKFEKGMNLAPSAGDYHRAEAQPHNVTPPMELASPLQAATIFGPAMLAAGAVALVMRTRQRLNR